MKFHLAATAFFFLSLPFSGFGDTPISLAKASELPVPMEEWAIKSKAYTGPLMEEHCLSIQPDAVVRSIGKKVWMDQVQGFKGILVLHPYTPNDPALLVFPVTGADSGKTLNIKARGSNMKPGGKMVFKNGETVLDEFEIDSDWVELSVPIPPGAREIRLEWHAIGWAWEMVWIDEISVSAPTRGS